MIEELMLPLLESNILDNDTGKVTFNDEAKALIHRIAEECKKTKLAEFSNDKRSIEYSESLTAEQVYLDLLDKIADAPTMFHAMVSVRIIMPILSSKLE